MRCNFGGSANFSRLDSSTMTKPQARLSESQKAAVCNYYKKNPRMKLRVQNRTQARERSKAGTDVNQSIFSLESNFITAHLPTISPPKLHISSSTGAMCKAEGICTYYVKRRSGRAKGVQFSRECNFRGCNYRGTTVHICN